VQVVNFFVYGTLVLAFAIRMRLAIAGTRGSIGAPVALGQQESRAAVVMPIRSALTCQSLDVMSVS
jgi:hypothetical protein